MFKEATHGCTRWLTFFMNGKLSRYERLEGVCVLGVEGSRLSNSLAVVLMEVADANPTGWKAL